MEQFMKKALNQFIEDVTDKIFLMIQNDNKLMREYLDLLNRHKENIDLDTLNRNIGKYIKNHLNLGNMDECKNPKSTLIRTFTRHKIVKEEKR